jgi:predicted  nucleic acid-binding Zn-ribbon protein
METLMHNSHSLKENTQMQSDIELLLKLQVIDYDLGELERSKEYLPDMMANLNREIDEAQVKLDATEKDLEETKIAQKNLEVDIKTKESELAKYQQQMMTIKTNKEYDALVAEIDAVKTEISEKEKLLLAAMEKIESLEQALPEIQEQLGKIKTNNTKQLEVLQDKIDAIGDTVSGKQAEREGILSDIPRRTMSVYERVRKGKGGSAVVPVKKRSCSACHKALTPKLVQEIRRGDRIYTCENCGRLLYWDDDISDE